MDAVEKTQLAIAYALKTILAELPYELAEEEACSAREVKEAVVAETAEPGLGANCPAGDWVPFVPDVLLQEFDSCVFDGEIGPICACVCAGSLRRRSLVLCSPLGGGSRVGAVDGRGRGGGARCAGAGSDSMSRPCWSEPVVPTLPSPQEN